MKSLSGIDGAFLHLETPQTPMHVASLHLFDLPAGYRGDFHADIQRLMRSRIQSAPVFTRKLAPMPLQFANPVWVEDDAIDLDYHVQRITLPSPGTPVQLQELAGRLHAELMDRSRPLWRLAVIDGLQSGQVGYYIQVHHAVLDGQAGVLLAQALFDITAEPRHVLPGMRLPGEHPGRAELAAAALKHDAGQYIKLLRHLPEVLKTLGGLFGARVAKARGPLGQSFAFGPKTPLNVPITAPRGYAAVSIPLASLKKLAQAHEATLNDVVLALCSGALRRYLAAHGGIPKKPLIAAMPISLRKAGNVEFTTQATMSLVNLNTHIADPVKRMRAIRDSASAVKALARQAQDVLPTDFPSIGTPWLLQALAALYGRPAIAGAIPTIANLAISNVPGPQVPLYAAGARMATYWPLSIVEHGLALNITVMSYAGAMGFGFTTAAAAVPDPQELSAALLAALHELQAPRRRAPRQNARSSAQATA
jgi:WS/DGAT/MGAT family acyltransferase